jgi:predicted kinase
MLMALGGLLRAGNDVVVDHGFWTPEDRARWRGAALDAGAITALIYLDVTHEELWARVNKRNELHKNDPNSIYFSESDLRRYGARFIPPQADEPHLLYDGSPEIVRSWERSRT